MADNAFRGTSCILGDAPGNQEERKLMGGWGASRLLVRNMCMFWWEGHGSLSTGRVVSWKQHRPLLLAHHCLGALDISLNLHLLACKQAGFLPPVPLGGPMRWHLSGGPTFPRLPWQAAVSGAQPGQGHPRL